MVNAAKMHAEYTNEPYTREDDEEWPRYRCRIAIDYGIPLVIETEIRYPEYRAILVEMGAKHLNAGRTHLYAHTREIIAEHDAKFRWKEA